jgi:predicted amidophosphoribosyltransferase
MPNSVQEDAPAYPCWSCLKPVTEDERAENDGFCPHCMAELDSEDWPPSR